MGFIYVVRFKAENIDVGAFPTETDNKTRVIGTRFTGNCDYITPEFECDTNRNHITDGVIYSINPGGDETLITVFNGDYFEEIK